MNKKVILIITIILVCIFLFYINKENLDVLPVKEYRDSSCPPPGGDPNRLFINTPKNEIPYTRPGRYLSFFVPIGWPQLLFTIVASTPHDRKFIHLFQSFGNNRLYGSRQNIGNYWRCLNHLANKANLGNDHFSTHFSQYFPF